MLPRRQGPIELPAAVFSPIRSISSKCLATPSSDPASLPFFSHEAEGAPVPDSDSFGGPRFSPPTKLSLRRDPRQIAPRPPGAFFCPAPPPRFSTLPHSTDELSLPPGRNFRSLPRCRRATRKPRPAAPPRGSRAAAPAANAGGPGAGRSLRPTWREQGHRELPGKCRPLRQRPRPAPAPE